MRYLFWLAIFMVSLILFSIWASFGLINDATSIVAPVSSFINRNLSLFLVWHMIVYFSIFSGLYLYANHMINKQKLNIAKKKEALIFSFLASLLIIVIDLIYYLGRVSL